MPEALKRKLMAQARKKGFSKERTGAYVYGTLRDTGWKPAREKFANFVKNTKRKGRNKK